MANIIELASVYKRLREFEIRYKQLKYLRKFNDYRQKFIDQIIKVSSKAAYASSLLVGKNDKIAADKAAVDAMRQYLNHMDINGKVVIGEGELDEAPMLYIGEELGTKNGPDIDIAVDPLEGTNFAAKNIPGFSEMNEEWDQRAPLGWDTKDPEPVAKVVNFLLSDLSEVVTGEIIHADGGVHSIGGSMLPK